VNKTLGPGRLLVAVYGVFALSASARASFQLFAKFDEAPLAYSLSALSAFVYIIATIALARGEQSRGLAFATVGFELVGVISVGALSLLLPELFAHPSVWSGFGSGYAFIPLLLPILGLIWLRRERARNN
jgi:cytochrome bd-type quinol oxidase subunit 2